MKENEIMIGLKSIPGYSGLYSIDEDGNVFSHRKNAFIKPFTNHRGYLMVHLYDGNKTRRGFPIHRIVAITYIPNPCNLPEVDHIDTNRRNNNVSNLRWCTRKQNCNNPISLKHAGECRKGEKHYLYGKNLSEETKRIMSEAKKGHIVSKETRQKISIANKGRKLSESHKISLSEAKRGKYMGRDNWNSKPVKQYDKNMVLLSVWDSCSDVQRELGISTTSIVNCIKGRSKTAGGYIWKY